MFAFRIGILFFLHGGKSTIHDENDAIAVVGLPKPGDFKSRGTPDVATRVGGAAWVKTVRVTSTPDNKMRCLSTVRLVETIGIIHGRLCV